MREAEVEAVEDEFGLKFPPDYRLFLATLHTTDPVRVRYEDGRIASEEGRPFRDWQGDRKPILDALDWPLGGLLWSIEAGGSWREAWGERPDGRSDREARVRELASDGPPLIPISGHRYLVGDLASRSNPVLSIYGLDVIVYADSFGSWLVDTLATSLDRDLSELTPASPQRSGRIPFWQDIIDK